MRKLLIIAGVPIDDLNMEETLERIGLFIKSGKPHQIATVNADFVIKIWEDPELRNILYNCDLLSADGMPLVWGAKLLGVNLRGRVTGADMVPAIAERSASLGWRVFLLGGMPGIAEKASKVLTEKYPGFTVAGIYSPGFAPVVEMSDEIIEKVHEADPDILLVAFGNPKQEKWIYMHKEELGVPVMIGIGGSLDFAAGEIHRAPQWMQKSGLEWVFRLIQEPRRMWRRYFVDLIQFNKIFFLQFWRNIIGIRKGKLVIESRRARQKFYKRSIYQEIILNGPITINERSKVQAEVEKSILSLRSERGFPGVLLNMTGVTFIDSSGMGMLVNLSKMAHQAGKKVVLFDVKPEIMTTLRLIKLDQFLTFMKRDDIPESEKSTTGVRVVKDWCIIPVVTRLEGRSVGEFAGNLEKLSLAHNLFIADFQATSFMDSSGIAMLIRIQKILIDHNGTLVLASLQKDVCRVLELSGVARRFNIYNSVDEALLKAPQDVSVGSESKETVL